MKRYRFVIVAVALLACMVWFVCRWQHTLINVYEDSWWVSTTDYAWHTEYPTFDSGRERLYELEQLAEARKWATVLPLAKSMMQDFVYSDNDDERVLAAIAMRYALLAESCTGMLPFHIMQYPIHTPEDFVMFRVNGRDACLFNLFFFRELGLRDEVFHQAMQYHLDFAPCTHRALRLMTENADSRVAGKLRMLKDNDCVEHDEQTLKLRSSAFVFGDPMIKLFAAILDAQPTNSRVFDYLALSLVMQGRKEKVQQLLRICPVYSESTLPPIYR